MKGKIIWLFLGISCLGTLQSQDEQILEVLDQYIITSQQQWEVPGLAIAIVKKGVPLFSKGYGLKQLGDPAPVDKKTLFAICSTTKAMTAACMAMLIDEGLAHWDDPVINHLPEFQLLDPYITRHLRIRDLFTHNSGFGEADALWYLWQYQPDDILARMRFLPPSYPFRGGYTYQNIMYAAAGKVIEKLSGITWEEMIEQRIFQPLDMKNSFANQELSKGYLNRAIPHYKVDGVITPIQDGSADLIAPAGAVWSTIEDMQKWMLFVLDSARVDGQRLISEKNYREWLTPQTIVTDDGFYPTQQLTKPHWKTYALGWFQHDYQGRPVSFHTGSLQGTVAMIGLIGDEDLGVYIFGNLDHAEVRHAIMYKAFDLFGKSDPDRDWSTEFLNLYQKEKSGTEDSTLMSADIPPTYPLSSYAGIYEDPLLGKLEIVQEGGLLKAKIDSKLEGQMIHQRHDTFSLSFPGQPWVSKHSIRFEDDGNNSMNLNFLDRQFKKASN